jgi:hypothetical protein
MEKAASAKRHHLVRRPIQGGAPKGTRVPSLHGTPTVQQTDATTLIRVVLRGALSVGTERAPAGPEMPAFGWVLNDDQVADVLTYIRNTWETRQLLWTPPQSKRNGRRSSSAAIDARSREIHDPNNCKHDNDRGQTEAEHEPNITPGHAVSRLARRYYWALFRAVGRVHGAFLNFRTLIAQVWLTVGRPTNRRRLCARDPWLGHSALNLALQLIAATVDLAEIVVDQLTPLLFDLAFYLFPVPFDPVPVHLPSPQ